VVVIRWLKRLKEAIYEDGRYSGMSVGNWWYDYSLSRNCKHLNHADCYESACQCDCHLEELRNDMAS